MGHESPAQYNPADYVMDLVNQDMKVREELKEAYLQNRIISDQQVASHQLQQQQNIIQKVAQYLVAEPSGNEADLTNPDKVNLLPNNIKANGLLDFYHKC